MTSKQIKHLHPIKDQEGNQIGRINLVNYLNSTEIPHIEYDLDEAHWNKGIMTKELAEYLKLCKENKITKLMAVIEEENEVSRKVLTKNNFVKLTKMRDYDVYFIKL